MAQLVTQTGGRVLSASDPSALAGHEHSLWRLLTLLALIAFLVGVAGRMLAGSGSRASQARETRQPAGV
jgi:hypothetical protein